MGKGGVFLVAFLIIRVARSAVIPDSTCPALPVPGRITGSPGKCGVGCAPIPISDINKCRYDISQCANVPPGTTCWIQCKAPYTGTPVKALCSPNNTSPSTVPKYQFPDCSLPQSACPELTTAPTGVTKLSNGSWGCAPGYGGVAVSRCVPIDASCTVGREVTGCLPLKNCAPLGSLGDTDPCVINATFCFAVAPGDSCLVGCRIPYSGRQSVAICPPGNTDPKTPLLLLPPKCTLLCDDPPAAPAGYARDLSSSLGWKCAEGYGGVASWNCSIDANCVSRKVLSGCAPLQSCALPKYDTCRFDFTACTKASLLPGGSCSVKCLAPYTGGQAVTASCPNGNVVPQQPLLWIPPACTLDCDVLAPVTVGYVSQPYTYTSTGWQCVPGYSGTVKRTCSLTSDCLVQLSMSGCALLLKCVGPKLPPDQKCQYSAGSCREVASGESCEVSCQYPFKGEPVDSYCPPNNTQARRPLIWNLPSCVLQCLDPNPIPPQYAKAPDGKTWLCAGGFTGTPVFSCSVDSQCNPVPKLTGCNTLQPCVIPASAACSIDWSDCQGAKIMPGGSCTISCKSGYAGAPQTATCPVGNVDPTLELSYIDPGCKEICQESNAVGYYRPQYGCAGPSFIGLPSYSCATDRSCKPLVTFRGCNRPARCAAPNISAYADILVAGAGPECWLDISACKRLGLNESCQVKCAPPFVGVPTTAFCPSNNVDTTKEPYWIPPLCYLPSCPDPTPALQAYSLVERCYRCAPGFAGAGHRTCVATKPPNGGACTVQAKYSGCFPVQPCSPLIPVDQCRIDTSQCLHLLPGKSCTVSCKFPYVGAGSNDTTTATCPADNTNTLNPPYWQDSEDWVQCVLTCQPPPVLPRGYVTGASKGWPTIPYLCADGYNGTVVTQCIIDQQSCNSTMVFSGCLPVVPCLVLQLDACKYDVSQCPALLQPGESCSLYCKPPYSASIGGGSAACPLLNTDPNALIFRDPYCVLGCGDVIRQVGYNKSTGSWACSPGYFAPGAIYKTCATDRSCTVLPTLVGCYPIVPCAPLVLASDAGCRVDLSDCASVASGALCTLTCAPGYYGQGIAAACPPTNINVSRSLNFAVPQCDCTPPPVLPAGYRRTGAKLTLACDIGYLGTPVQSCSVSWPNCNKIVTYSGCIKLQPCSGPFWPFDPMCYLDMDAINCTVPMPPGSSCAFQCKAPYYSPNASIASCPSNNVQYLSAPIWTTPPSCVLQGCQVKLPSIGYKTGNLQCAPGWRGSPITTCEEKPNCGGGYVAFSGCLKLAGCTLPPVAFSTAPKDSCMLDFSSCVGIQAGGRCTVRCKSPFYGLESPAFCPPDNLDPKTEIIWVKPQCSLFCANPAVTPPGYVLTPDCGWQCAYGYAGLATPVCEVNPSCVPKPLNLTNCTKQEECSIPPASLIGVCQFDLSKCPRTLVPGATCTAMCKPPYVGNAFAASCPASNTIRGAPFALPAGACSLSCPDPDPLPDGYIRGPSGAWQCAPDYKGTAIGGCVLDQNCANPSLSLSGCYYSVRCAPLRLTDVCQFDVSDCSAVDPGTSCTISCKPPYFGNLTGDDSNATVDAFCPDPNTDLNRQPAFASLPVCEPLCSDPFPVPPEYVKQFDGSWACVPEALGTAAAVCEVSPSCKPKLVLTGCRLRQPCSMASLNPCMVDIGNCTSPSPGEECLVSCKAPNFGDDVNGTCSPDNVDPNAPPDWSPHAPLCRCPDPVYVPDGYEEVDGAWTCARNYGGTAVVVCTPEPDCSPSYSFKGCVPVQPCTAPPSIYLGNTSTCSSPNAGSNCTIPCITSQCVAGGPLVFNCPDGNTQPNTAPTLLSGNCSVTCRVCTMDFKDVDPRPGIINGTLTFGPAHNNGNTLLQDVTGYRVFAADSCGKEQPGVLNIVVPKGANDFYCCLSQAYSVALGQVALLTSTAKIMVALQTTLGELPQAASFTIQDLTGTSSTLASNIGPPVFTSGAGQRHSQAFSVLAIVVFAPLVAFFLSPDSPSLCIEASWLSPRRC